MAKLVLKFKKGKVEEREISQYLGYTEDYKVLIYIDEKGKRHDINRDSLEEVVIPEEVLQQAHNHKHDH